VFIIVKNEDLKEKSDLCKNAPFLMKRIKTAQEYDVTEV